MLQDVRYALRTMRLNPGFTAIAILALALGIGANTAIFTVVSAVMLRPLPYPDSERLYCIQRSYGREAVDAVTGTNAVFFRERSQVYEAVSAFDLIGAGTNLIGSGEPQRVKSIRVTPEFFKVIGLTPALGRGFTSDEAKPNGPNVAVLSYGLWSRQFGGDPNILSRRVLLNGSPYSVVGIMPEGFDMSPAADIWMPLPLEASSTDKANVYVLVGRLKPGISRQQAQADCERVFAEFRREYPDDYAHLKFRSYPWQEAIYGELRPALLMLLAAVALVLLIACANLANLLLARAAARGKEIAVRSAMGAGRLRLVRQLITESVALALAGAIVGLGFAYWGLKALLALSPGDIPQLASVSIDWRVMLFTIAIALATGVLFGLAPAIQSGRVDLADALKESGRGTSSGARGNRLRSILVVSEVALSLVLLVSATLLIRSFINLRKVDPGFQVGNVLTMQMSLSGERFQKTQPTADLVRRVLQRIETLPGVEYAAMATNLPTELGPDLPFEIEGLEKGAKDSTGEAQYRFVSPNFFSALSIPLKSGRVFTENDRGNSDSVIIINAALAKTHFKDKNPIGERITIGREMGPEFADRTRQIVGVVGDVHELGLQEEAPATVYLPNAQVPDSITALTSRLLPTSWVVRTTVPPASLAEQVRREILSVDSGQAVSNVRTMEQLLSKSLDGRRFNTLLLTLFAALALVLSIVGIYGVMSYSVTQRTHEIGIRLALGASRAQTLAMVGRQAAGLAGVGAVIGMACGLGATRVLKGMLYGVQQSDPPTFGGVTLLLVLCAVAASYLPALRATRVDPVNSLRHE